MLTTLERVEGPLTTFNLSTLTMTSVTCIAEIVK